MPPAHPLVVHLAVVLLPLVALGAIVVVASSKARERYGSLLAIGSVVATAATMGARFSGESLAGTTTATGTLGAHMFWGLIAPWPALGLMLTLIGYLLAARGSNRLLQRVLGAVTVVLALASLAVVVVTGHLGASAVWVG